MSATLLHRTSTLGKLIAASGVRADSLFAADKELSVPLSKSEACCLFWVVGSSLQAAEAQVLRRLHSEVAECVHCAGGRTLEDNATSGLVRLERCGREGGMSAEDAAMRLGQLLCRWARQQSPSVRLRAAVHVGELQTFELPATGRRAHLGPVVDSCKSLALGAEGNYVVHLSARAREGLVALGGERLRLSRRGGSYYAEAGAAEEAPRGQASLAELVAEEFDVRPAPEAAPAGARDGSEADIRGMLFRDFRRYLQSHGVDAEKYGRGDAKTLREFYSDVAIERDSNLEVVGGVLRRLKEVIRIQLLTRGDDNKLRELRIDSQSRADGSFRKRNEKLVAVLRAHEGQRWKEALPQFFEEKFGLSKTDQTACLSVKWDSYKFEEEAHVSGTIPGILTTYKMHNIVVNVKDPAHPQLARMGLPGGVDFSTDKLTGEHRWKWAEIGGEKEAKLLAKLAKANGGQIQLTPTAFSELYDEVYDSCQASLELAEDGELCRKVRVLKVWLHADILAADQVLLLDSKIQRGKCDEADKGRPLTMRLPQGKTWQQAVETLFHKRLGITPETQLSCIAVDLASHQSREDRGVSRSYPGIQTLYQIDEVTARVVMNEVDTATLHRIGLPDGQNFSFSRWEPAKGPGAGSMTIMHWSWQSSHDISAVRVRRAPSLTDRHSEAWWAEVREQRRHLLVPELDGDMQGGARGGAGGSWFSFSNATVLESLMRGKKVDMKRARRAAREICNPNYTCKDFYEDIVAAFPELNLYLVGDMTSGRAGEDEYQRTLGAMFSFFWLMRLPLDGSESFCYGLDESWKPRECPPDSSLEAQEEWAKRKAFHKDAEWASLHSLLVDAGLLASDDEVSSNVGRQKSFLVASSKQRDDLARRHNTERILAMLVLTAIHDIMKTVPLLPTVSQKHGPFRGYQVGEVINDHDAALAYVLEFYPSLLPSFAGLPQEQRETIKFTQSKMEYNMGWLVQAEAPPGALFRKFKRVIESGQASPQDLAFYFTHWFTDLAGAEPFPTEGCEKFVLRFPKHVLNQFLLSFSIVQSISAPGATEAKVYEDYLQWRWDSHKPALGPAPMGKGSIAKMRLVVMAQGDSEAIVRAFDALPEEDMEVLSTEMSMVDIWKQSWSRERSEFRGPAILVYYAPALMQKAGKQDPHGALLLLADVFRQARALWPLSEAAGNWWVSVRVDQLKELTVREIRESNPSKVWAVTKLTSREGAVQRMSLSETRAGGWHTNHRIIDVSDRPEGACRQVPESAAAAAARDPEGQIHSI